MIKIPQNLELYKQKFSTVSLICHAPRLGCKFYNAYILYGELKRQFFFAVRNIRFAVWKSTATIFKT